MADSAITSQRIRRITESIITLPTLPTVVSKMIELVDNPRTSAGSLARLISADQVLTARVLKLANSAYYGLSREVSTVDTAIVVLGFNAVRDMGLSLSVLNAFKNAGPEQTFDNVLFWGHSVGCGVGARMLARRYCRRLAGEAFVGGLLHDIGKLVLSQYATREFEEVLRLVTSEDADFEAAEDAVLGTRHAHVGAWLGEKWKLPQAIVESIRYHHDSWLAPAEPVLAGIVSLSDHLCHLTKTGRSGRLRMEHPSPRLWEVLSSNGLALGTEALEELQVQFLLEFDQSQAFVSSLYE